MIVPRQSDTSLDDVRASMCRIGSIVCDALVAAAPGLAGRVEVHRGPLETTEWSSTICFDGLGPGEVVLDGAKLVGLSQRLTRQAARFQACWHTVYDPRALVELLPVASRPALDALRPVATLDAAVVGRRARAPPRRPVRRAVVRAAAHPSAPLAVSERSTRVRSLIARGSVRSSLGWPERGRWGRFGGQMGENG